MKRDDFHFEILHSPSFSRIYIFETNPSIIQTMIYEMPILKNTWGFCFLALMFSFSGSGQTIKPDIRSETYHGMFHDTRQMISGKTITFSDSIVRVHPDSGGQLLYVYLRKKGSLPWGNQPFEDLVLYDLRKDEVLWNLRYNHQHGYYWHSDTVLIESVNNKVNIINPLSGARIWQKEGAIYGIHDKTKTAFFYPYKDARNLSDNLQGLNLSSGNARWERKVTRNDGWNALINLGDSVVIVSSYGLYAIDLSTGEGWSYKMRTGKIIDTGNGIQPHLVSGGFGVMDDANHTGTQMSPVPVIYNTNYYAVYDKLNQNTNSNILVEKNHVYIAGNAYLVKLDLNTGEQVWKVHLGQKKDIKSHIFMRDDRLILLNFGREIGLDAPSSAADPFLLAVDALTGEVAYYNIIPSGINFVHDYKIYDEYIMLLCQRGLYKINLDDGAEMGEIKLGYKFDFPGAFIVQNHYLKTDSNGFVYLPDEKEKLVLVSGIDGVMTVNPETMSTIELTGHLFEAHDIDGIQMAERGGETFLLNDSLEAKATLQLSGRAKKYGDSIYDIQGSKLIIIPAEALIELDISEN